MQFNGLVSAYTIQKYKPQKTKVNDAEIANDIKQEFNGRKLNEVIVSDLSYVRVRGNWNYVCILIDLHAREIIGTSCGIHKNADLVQDAFVSVKKALTRIHYFYTDRGSEFKNHKFDELLESFGIERSLSKKGCPYDNALAEATFEIIKTEFVRRHIFDSLEELKEQLSNYVDWFNNKRIHSTLGYMSPIEYQMVATN